VIFQGTPCRGPLPADLSELGTFPVFTASHFLSAVTSTARPNSFSHQHEQIALPLFSARDAFAQATCCEPSPSIGRSEPRFSHCRLILSRSVWILSPEPSPAAVSQRFSLVVPAAQGFFSSGSLFSQGSTRERPPSPDGVV
jgi:hypothetical protein